MSVDLLKVLCQVGRRVRCGEQCALVLGLVREPEQGWCVVLDALDGGTLEFVPLAIYRDWREVRA